MPDTPDEIDPFQDKGEAGEEEPLQTFRLKVGMTFAAGVLSIVGTTALLIILNQDVQRLNKPVGIDVILPVPSVMPDPSTMPSASVTATATSSQSSKPPTVSGTPGPGPTQIPEATSTFAVVALQSLSCTPSAVAPTETAICTVRLTTPAQGTVSIDIAASDTAALGVPSSVSIDTGSDSVTFEATAASDVTTTTTITVTATMGTVSKNYSVTVEVPAL